jgi:hypothetical protein
MRENFFILMIALSIFEIHGQNTGVAADFRYENCIND